MSPPQATGQDVWRNDLRGCVNDIKQSEKYLRDQHQLQSDQIRMLTASGPHSLASDRPIEDAKDWPTYDNIKKEFEEIMTKAKEGDWVYIHYAGHGAQVPTIYQKEKSYQDNTGKDEVLVTVDAGIGGRLFYDVELALLLRRMARQKLLVTLVLDCCHSGGATRAGEKETELGLLARGLESDNELLKGNDAPDQSLLDAAHPDDIDWIGSIKRDAVDAGPLIFKDGDYCLLAACRANETAKEVAGEGRLTSTLFKTLAELRNKGHPHISHGHLYDILVAKFSEKGWANLGAHFGPQNPILIGKKFPSFFGSNSDIPPGSTSVVKVESGNIQLAVGTAHCVHTGSQYAIFTLESRADNANQDAIAVATISKVGDITSEATLYSQDPKKLLEVKVGCLGKLLTQVTPKEVHVRFINSDPERSEVEERLRNKWSALITPGIKLHLNDQPPAVGSIEHLVFTVEIAEGKYLVNLENGTVLDGIPSLETGEENDRALVGLIQHLAKFILVRGLQNSHPNSALRNNFSVTLKVNGQEKPTDQTVDVEDDAEVDLIVTNLYKITKGLEMEDNDKKTLNVVLFNLNPQFGITKVKINGPAYETVQPEKTLKLELTAQFPKELSRQTVEDALLLIVTLEPTSFDNLSLEKLDKTTLAKRGEQAYESLDLLLDMFETRRDVVPRSIAKCIREWQTARVIMRVSKAKSNP